MQKSDDADFSGFRQPKANYSKLPHQFINLLPQFKSLAELKCILYLLRHTWGYREYNKSKLISIDEFVHGRKRKNGTRMDSGTGLSEQGVRDGLETAMGNKFILCEIDDSDKGRVKKFYKLNSATVKNVVSGVQSLDPQDVDLPPQSLDLNPQNSLPRTEKETKERNYKKDNMPNGTKPLTPFVEMKNAIHAAFGYDKDKTTPATWNLIGKAASELLAAGATPDDMNGLYKYCASKFDNFKAMALATNWSDYQTKRQSNGKKPYNMFEDKELMETSRIMRGEK